MTDLVHVRSDCRHGLELPGVLARPIQDLGHKCVFVYQEVEHDILIKLLQYLGRAIQEKVSFYCATATPVNAGQCSSLHLVLAVLKRDGTNVVTDSSCKATSGNWVSPYDGVATTLASDLDIVSLTFVVLMAVRCSDD